MSISLGEFEFIRAFVRESAGIVLDDGKEYLVEARLEPVARREGLGDIAGIVRLLRAKPAPTDLARKVVEALTINETSFFRDWKPFEALRLSVIPEIVRTGAGRRTLDVWSAACSSGQEIYSVAMLLREHFPDVERWTVQLHASDISREMLARTQGGRYSTLEVNRGLPAKLLAKWFTRDGAEWVVREELRRLVHPVHVNLTGIWPSLPQMDVVLMRNVLIYFDVPTKKKILDRIRAAVRHGGVLMLGGGETTLGLCEGWERVEAAATVYFRRV